MSGLDVEAVLAAHATYAQWADDAPRCQCGAALDTQEFALTEHIAAAARAHVAAVLREQIEVAQAMAWAEGASAGIRTPPHLAYMLTNPYRAALVAPSRVPGEET